MPPPQQPAAPPAGQFDFIMQDPQQPKRSLVPGDKRQIMILLALGIGVIALLAVVGSLIFGGKKSASVDIISAISQEQELARVSDLASIKATDPNTRAMAATISAVFNSDSTTLKNYLKKNGTKLTTKQLLSPDKKTNDAALTTAALDNHFDDVYLSLVATKLKPYQTSLTTAFNVSKNSGKVLLKTAYTNTEVLSASQLLATPTQ